MVLGMSGRNGGETRRNGSLRNKDRGSSANSSQYATPNQPAVPPHKHKPPSAEQVHIAKILGDTTPGNHDDLVKQVSMVVVDRMEDDIIVALHDNDYNVEKTIEALLDSVDNSQEWTTMGGKGKGKRRQQETEDKQPNRGSRPSTRGGGVTKRSGNREGNSGGGSASSYPEGLSSGPSDVGRSRPVQKPGGIRYRRNDGRFGDNGRRTERGRGGRGGMSASHRKDIKSSAPPPPTNKPNEDIWENDDSTTNIVDQQSNDLTKNTLVEVSSLEVVVDNDEWVMVDHPLSSSLQPSSSAGLFPEALTSTVSYTSASHDVTSSFTDDKRLQISPALPPMDDSHVIGKSRRYRSSRIPSQPVEMPSYMMDSLGTGMDGLDIDFMSVEEVEPDPPVAPPTLPHSYTGDVPTSPQVTISQPSLLPSPHYTSSLTDDTAVIATGLSTSFTETPPAKLDPPPGLTHPSQHHHGNNIPTGGVAAGNVLLTQSLNMSSTTNELHNVLAPSTTTQLHSTNYPLPLQANSSSHDKSGGMSSIAGSVPPQSEPLFASHPPQASTTVTMVTHSASQHAPLTSSFSKVPHGGGNKMHGVLSMAPAAVYPHMLPQFPHYGTAPMMMPPTYSYDIETFNRYQQGFYNQHQTTSDTLVTPTPGTVMGRDHSITSFPPTDNKYDVTSPVGGTVNNQQQQQQQQQAGGIQSHTFYGTPYNYFMYPHLGMAAAAGYSATMNHKIAGGGGATYPVGTSYQPSHQYGQPYDADDYTKMLYSKPNAIPATSTEFQSYKGPFDTKSIYSNFVPGAPPMGGYIMTAPQGTIMTTPHDASKHRSNNNNWSNRN